MQSSCARSVSYCKSLYLSAMLSAPLSPRAQCMCAKEINIKRTVIGILVYTHGTNICTFGAERGNTAKVIQ